ncbi:hypothetical protein ABPG74_022014 [Tetrahymena malaccensis]
MIESIKNKAKDDPRFRKILGIVLMFIACCSFCYAAFVIKMLKNMNTSQLLLYRSAFSFIVNLSQLKKEKIFFQDEHISKIAYIRSIFAGIVDFSMIGAYQYLKLSEAVSLMLTYPIIKCIFAKIFLEENVRRPIFLPSILNIIGILLIIKPQIIIGFFTSSSSDDISFLSKEQRDQMRHQTFGYFLAIIFSLSLSTMDIIIHNMRRKLSQAVLMQYGYFGSIISSGLMITWRQYNNANLDINNLILICTAGATYFAGQRLFGKALLLGRSSQIIPLTYLQILIQIFIDIYVFEQNLSPISIIGSIFITAGNLKTIAN